MSVITSLHTLPENASASRPRHVSDDKFLRDVEESAQLRVLLGEAVISLLSRSTTTLTEW